MKSLKPEEAAEIKGCTKTTVYRNVRRGLLNEDPDSDAVRVLQDERFEAWDPHDGIGGKREGAGRPPISEYELKKVTAYIPAPHRDFLKNKGDGSISKGLRDVLKDYLNEE